MRKTVIFLFLLAIVTWIASPASAANEIQVTISDGTTVLTAAGGCTINTSTCVYNSTTNTYTITSYTISASAVLNRGFALQASSAAGTTTSVPEVLALTASSTGNCTAPCTRHFPSGSATAQTGDTFKLQDSGSTNRFRVVKTDASTDKIEVKGLKSTSTATGVNKTLTITFETKAGAFTAVPTGTYAAGASVKGSYRTGTSGIATACSSESTPCVRQVLKVLGVSLNGQDAGAALATYTATVPCGNTVSCGPGGSYTPSAISPQDQFFATDTSSISISSINCTLVSGNCPVVQKGVLQVLATAQNQVFTSTNSANLYFAGVSVEDPNGLAGVLAAIAAEGGTDVWAGYDSCQLGYRAVWQPPLTNQTRNILNNASIPVKVDVQKAIWAPASNGYTMVSIPVSDPPPAGDGILPPGDQKCNDSGYVIYAPGTPLLFKDITTAILTYDVITGNQFSGDTRLGNLNFADCTDSAEIRLEVALAKDGVGVGNLVVYLGGGGIDPLNVKGFCDNASLSGTNLPDNTALRVDPSFLRQDVAHDCCLTWAQAKKPGAFGKFQVLAAFMVVDEGKTPPATPSNHQVSFVSGNINGVSSAGSLRIATGFEPTCNIPPDGRSIQFLRYEPGGCDQGPVGVPQPIFTATDTTVTCDTTVNPPSGEVRTTVNVNDIQAVAGGTTYDVYLQFNGGISISPAGRLCLK